MKLTEDHMLNGILGVLALNGWMCHHARRSDLGIAVGDTGFPDIVACHPDGRLLVLELKSETGRYRPGQEAWLAAFSRAGVDARTIWPKDYDPLIRELAGDRLITMTGRSTP